MIEEKAGLPDASGQEVDANVAQRNDEARLRFRIILQSRTAPSPHRRNAG